MFYVFLYFLIPILFVIGFVALNLQHKWLTKDDFDDDYDDFICPIVFGLLFWPITLIIVGAIAGWTWFYKNLIPDDKWKNQD